MTTDIIKDQPETAIHIGFINGYRDGTIRPDNFITRAEVAVILWRLIKDPAKYASGSGALKAVKAGLWYSQAVNFLAQKGALKVFGDGGFKPKRTVTRAEFVAIVSNFDRLPRGAPNPFSDITPDHWAYDHIISAYTKRWISGYPDGEFKPQNNITRAEAVAMINRVLGIVPDKTMAAAALHKPYPDLPADHWAFTAMMEASTEQADRSSILFFY